MQFRAIYPYEYSLTHKTLKEGVVNRFEINLDSTAERIDESIHLEKSKCQTAIIQNHQMRRCLKTNIVGCPKNPECDNRKVFIGMPFSAKHTDSYNFGIKPALAAVGMRSYRADDKIKNQDIMCKICEEMQICKYLVFNVSGLNPNVMLELGLSYGLGKETIIIKDEETEMISDISNIEYIEYLHAHDLMEKLISYFE